MGMAADILAIGPFSKAIAGRLEYPEERYAKTCDGAPVILTLFGITHGTTASTTFAALLGIDDPWDFNQHKLVPSKADVGALRDFFLTLQDGNEFLPDLEAFVVLRERGFDFYFRPNG